jgi:O-antigen ligase
MAVSLLAATPILYMAIERRSAEARAGSSQEREHMKKAAAMIAADYPLGVGANRYVAVANVGGYNARAGLAWTSAAAPVHNTYYLVAAEMGLAGLIAFISIFVAALSLSIGSLRTAPPGFGAEYAIGTTVVLLMLAAHSYVEWITMLYSNHVLFAMTIGVIVALRGIISVRHRPPQVSHLATNLMRT